MNLFLFLNSTIIIIIALNIISLYYVSLTLSIVSSIVYLILLIYIFYKKPFFFFMIITFAFFQFTSIISNVYLESGAYLTQTKIHTYLTGATLRLVTIDTFFIYFSYIFYLFYYKKFNKYRKLDIAINFLDPLFMEKIFLLVVLGLIGILTINGLIFQFPLLSLSQRFIYWSNHPFGSFFSKLLYFLSYVSLILAYLYEKYKNNKKLKRKIFFLAFSSIIIAILYANKFSWLSNFIVMWFIGFISAKYILNRYIPVKSIFKATVYLIPLFLSIIALSYMFVHGYVGDDLVNMIVNRIFSMQGEMYWAIDELVSSNQVNHNIWNLIVKFDNKPSGIFLLMEKITPDSTFKHFYENKIPFTMAYPAITLYSLGYVGAIISQIFFSFYWMTVVNVLISSLLNPNIIRFLLSLFLFAAMLWAMLLGSTYVLFTPFNLILLTLFIIELLFPYPIKKRLIINAK